MTWHNKQSRFETWILITKKTTYAWKYTLNSDIISEKQSL